jgi:hypothetical protein
MSEGTLVIVVLTFFVAEQTINPLQGGICLFGHSRPGRFGAVLSSSAPKAGEITASWLAGFDLTCPPGERCNVRYPTLRCSPKSRCAMIMIVGRSPGFALGAPPFNSHS